MLEMVALPNDLFQDPEWIALDNGVASPPPRMQGLLPHPRGCRGCFPTPEDAGVASPPPRMQGCIINTICLIISKCLATASFNLN